VFWFVCFVFMGLLYFGCCFELVGLRFGFCLDVLVWVCLLCFVGVGLYGLVCSLRLIFCV